MKTAKAPKTPNYENPGLFGVCGALAVQSSWLIAFGLSLAACATGSSQCEQQLSACIERCEKATNQRGLARNALPPQNTTRECESRCSCPHTPTTPKPQGPPTPTGNAQ